MGEEETKKAEPEAAAEPAPSNEEQTSAEQEKASTDVSKEEKVAEIPDKKIADILAEKAPRIQITRILHADSALAKIETEKRFALIKAWEENEKAKVDNKAYKKISATLTWENSKKACVEAEIKKFEEKMEAKKAAYAEKMRNKIAEIHKSAEQKRATIDAQKGKDHLKLSETAEKFRATGYTPKKLLACFSGF